MSSLQEGGILGRGVPAEDPRGNDEHGARGGLCGGDVTVNRATKLKTLPVLFVTLLSIDSPGAEVDLPMQCPLTGQPRIGAGGGGGYLIHSP